jgi:hypothetical protein
MAGLRFLMLAIVTAPALALAQPAPTESVTVMGTKAREVVDQFVASFATPTPITGKIARWENGICPLIVGQRPAVAAYVAQRMKQVAVMVGAPVNASQSCAPNVEIVFTSAPQDLLNNVRAHDPDYLGFAESNAQRDKMAVVTRPIQGWYTTQTKDLDGMSKIDSGRHAGNGITLSNFTAVGLPGTVASRDPIYLPDATYARVTGNHISDGVRSAFYHVLIVADPSKLQDYGIGPLADYIALLALTQLNAPDTCQQLPSIVNLLAPGCDRRTDTLTENDIAYLIGLYKMNADKRLLTVQKNEIAEWMTQRLGGK